MFHPKGNLATLELVNDTGCTIYLEKGTVMGTAAKAEELPLPERGKSKMRKVQQATGRELPAHLRDLYKRSGKGLTDQDREDLRQLLIEYADVFAAHDLDLGCFNATPHTHTHTEDPCGGKNPDQTKNEEGSIHGFQGEEEKNLRAMLEAGVIQPSASLSASPPVLVRKRDGGVRWCLDFRRLNAVTKKDAFSLPSISDCIESRAGNRYMSRLDMASGYWQIEIHPDGREYTALITRFGLF